MHTPVSRRSTSRRRLCTAWLISSLALAPSTVKGATLPMAPLVLTSTAVSSTPATASSFNTIRRCRVESFEGSVAAGAFYTAAIGSAPRPVASASTSATSAVTSATAASTRLNLVLEPVALGWRVRILPATGTAPSPDYAEIATPPYQSPSPLLLTTDYLFRSQDVVAWNPRHFQFVADGASYRRLAALYAEFVRTNPPPSGRPPTSSSTNATGASTAQSAAASARLADLVSRAMPGEIKILDSRLVPGTANQSPAAAAVATHGHQTPYTTEQATGPANVSSAGAYGRVTWLHFRIRLTLPPGFRETGASGKIAWEPCL